MTRASPWRKGWSKVELRLLARGAESLCKDWPRSGPPGSTPAIDWEPRRPRQCELCDRPRLWVGSFQVGERIRRHPEATQHRLCAGCVQLVGGRLSRPMEAAARLKRQPRSVKTRTTWITREFPRTRTSCRALRPLLLPVSPPTLEVLAIERRYSRLQAERRELLVCMLQRDLSAGYGWVVGVSESGLDGPTNPRRPLFEPTVDDRPLQPPKRRCVYCGGMGAARLNEELPYLQRADALLRELPLPIFGTAKGKGATHFLVSRVCPVCLRRHRCNLEWLRLERGWLGRDSDDILTGQQLHELTLRSAGLPATRRKREHRDVAIRRDHGSGASDTGSLSRHYRITDRRVRQIIQIVSPTEIFVANRGEGDFSAPLPREREE